MNVTVPPTSTDTGSAASEACKFDAVQFLMVFFGSSSSASEVCFLVVDLDELEEFDFEFLEFELVFLEFDFEFEFDFLEFFDADWEVV